MTQAILHSVPSDSIPTLAQAPETPRYLVEAFLGRRTRTYFPEMAPSDTTLNAIVNDIASGQFEDVHRVIGMDLTAGRCWDASREVATHVLTVVLTDHAQVPHWCADFLEEHLGCAVVAMAEREAA